MLCSKQNIQKTLQYLDKNADIKEKTRFFLKLAGGKTSFGRIS